MNSWNFEQSQEKIMKNSNKHKNPQKRDYGADKIIAERDALKNELAIYKQFIEQGFFLEMAFLRFKRTQKPTNFNDVLK